MFIIQTTKIKKILQITTLKWWIPAIFWLFSLFLYWYTQKDVCLKVNMFFFLFILAELWLITTICYNFYKEKWLTVIITSLFLGVTHLILLISYFFLFTFSQVDYIDSLPKNLSIPENLELHLPIDDVDIRPDSIFTYTPHNIDILLYNYFQPGLYHYDVWLGKIDKGIIYLKAYEVTHEYALSSHNLSHQTTIEVFNPNDSIIRFGTDDCFTIYEGDWGAPYAARFELWYKPNNGKDEILLMDKVFKIEGWQR